MGRSGNRRVQFRQFEVRDDRCAMKVGNDGLLLGAWPDVTGVERILDVGTGSGLVALMAAQRAPKAHVHAVELEPLAAAQARENFQRSPFADRLELVEADIRSWSPQAIKWDVMLCNPPFFRGKPKSPDAARNLARHDDDLPIEQLFSTLAGLAHSGSVFYVIWPMDRLADLVAAGQAAGWIEWRRLFIKGTPAQLPDRLISVWGRQGVDEALTEELIIEVAPFSEEGTPDRTAAFKRLMAPFMERYAKFEPRSSS